VSERPVAARHVRQQAAAGASISSLRHSLVELPELDRMMLPLLDGSRDRAALLGILGAAAQRGEVKVELPADPAEARKRLEAELEQSLFRLARAAVLVG
jgi:hypothetical protein